MVESKDKSKSLQGTDSPVNRKKQRKTQKMYARYRRAFPNVAEMEAGQALDLHAKGRLVFVDVRDPDEQAVSMLPGALTEAEFLMHSARFKKKLVVCYCTIGYRSGLFVKQHGRRFPHMHNLCGGLLLWLHAGGTMEKNGATTRQVHVYGPKWALQPAGYLPVFKKK